MPMPLPLASSMLAALLVLALPAGSATAAVELPRPSPAASVSQRVGVADVKVEYFSPGRKDRKVWGELVPMGELWRTGANGATKITFSTDVRVAGKDVPAGSYALLTIPRKGTWTLILNADTSLAGTRGYDEKKDVARAEVKTRSAGRRERMTFLFEDTTDTGTDLVLEWDRLAVVIPIEADTPAAAAKNIDAAVKASASDLVSSARYYLDSDTEPAKALELATSAVRLDGGWIATYVLARAQAANGLYGDAAATAKKAHELGMTADYFFWKDEVEKNIEAWSKKASR